MQDEVTKHTKKVFREIKNPHHSLGQKATEIIIEIAIIVFAVTLSISLHNWSEHRHEHQVAGEFLKGLRTDLFKDIEALEENRKTIVNLDSNYSYLLGVKKEQRDDKALSSQIHRHLIYDITSTHLNTARYDGFKSSGKIETISNDSLKEKILFYYQQTITNVTDLENFLNAWQLKILDLDADKDSKLPIVDFVTTDKMQGLLGLGSHNFKISIANYEKAIKQAKEIIAEIDKEEEK